MNREQLFGSENEFTGWLRKIAGVPTPEGSGPQGIPARGLRLGIGDDAALIEPRRNRHLVLTADLSIEGVHFAQSLHAPKAVGHRALARSLSDIAAMGGQPRFAMLALAISREVSRRWLVAFLQGTMALARRFSVVVLGGDTAVGSKQIMVDVTVIGEVERTTALLRSGAQPGDRIFVAGELGLAALGLKLLRSGRPIRSPEARKALQAHLYPEPQCALGRYLAQRRLASSAIDVSDGLSTDLGRLAESSGVGACIWSERVPSPGSLKVDLSRSPLDLALHGGEDYKLLFTVPAKRTQLLPRRFQGTTIYEIGEIQEARHGVQIVRDGRPMRLKPLGYDHFRTSRQC
jgi:thiamine-monophosphate kinase